MKLQGSFYMGYLGTRQGLLFYFYTIDVEKTAKNDKLLELLESSGGVSELLAQFTIRFPPLMAIRSYRLRSSSFAFIKMNS